MPTRKKIAASTHAQPMGVEPYQSIGTTSNEDPTTTVYLWSNATGSPPTAAEVLRNGCLLLPNVGNQTQDQPVGEQGNIQAQNNYVAAWPFAIAPNASVAAPAYVCKPDNSAATFLTAGFTMPAVNANVAIAVLDSSGFSAASVYDPTGADKSTGIFVAGGNFCDIVTVDSATQITIKNRGLPGAVVTLNHG